MATDVPVVARPEDRANYEKGRRLLAAGEAKRALEPLTAAARAMPRDAAVAHDYGIALIRTGDTDRGLRVAGRMHTGTVELNGSPAGFLAPMGGVKWSGIGREFGPEGLEPFLEIKAIGISADLADALEKELDT